jgi:DNA-binding transcriptional ArsR family regulator
VNREFIKPEYDRALEHTGRKKIVQAIAQVGGTARFSVISRMTGVADNVLMHHLNVLRQYGIVEQIVDGGPYSLRYKTPLCFIFGEKTPEKVSYIGLLGDKNEREEAETEVALRLLKKEGIEVNLAYVVTSSTAAKTWKDRELPVNWILVDGDALTDIDKIADKVEVVLTELVRNRLVIMDCTSFNKPATIALYELAQRYLIPLIYVYEPKRKLKWLISKEHLLKRFKI